LDKILRAKTTSPGKSKKKKRGSARKRERIKDKKEKAIIKNIEKSNQSSIINFC